MSVGTRQRFTEARRCPICGGHRDLPKGEKQRCWGFLSDDGDWAHCTREEFAGDITAKDASKTFPHRLVGDCRCGKRHDGRHTVRTFEKTTRLNPRKIVETFQYVDMNGQLVHEAVRFEPKGFSQRRPDPDKPGEYIWNMNGVERVPYRLPAVVAAVAAGETVFVVEGERLVHELERIGRVATCNAEGAGKNIHSFAKHLGDADVVVINDCDAPGRDHAAQIVQSLRAVAGRLRMLDPDPSRGDTHDIKDILEGKTVEEATSAVASLIETAQEIPVARALDEEATANAPAFDSATIECGVVERKLSDVERLPFRPITEALANVSTIPNWIWWGYVALFVVTLIAGRPKAGKTTLLFALLRAILRGESFVDQPTTRARVLLLSEERNSTLKSKLERWGLNDDVHLLMRYEVGSVPFGEVIRQAVDYCLEHGLNVLVVDTFDKWSGLRGDAENSAGDVVAALQPLMDAAAQGIAVVIVAHQRKASGEYGQAIRGSNALVGAVDVVVELERADANKLPANARKLMAVSRFEETPEEAIIELNGTDYRYLGDSVAAKADTDVQKVLDAIHRLDAPDATQLANHTNIPAATVRRHIDRLLSQGLIEQHGLGRKGSPHTWRIVSTDTDHYAAESNNDDQLAA